MAVRRRGKSVMRCEQHAIHLARRREEHESEAKQSEINDEKKVSDEDMQIRHKDEKIDR